jgi:arylsulfatase A-like enzyme
MGSKWAVVLIGLLVLVSSDWLSAEPGQSGQKPNIIVFLVDDMGWTDAATYGSDLYQTPNIDRLARQGVKFTNAYAACTVCSPTRAALMTGMHPGRLNVTDWIDGHWAHRSDEWRAKRPLRPPEWTKRLEKQYTTLAEALQSGGYKTAHLGKWHLTPQFRQSGVSKAETREYYPTQQGFEVNVAGNSWGMPGSYYWPYANNGSDSMERRTAMFPPKAKHRGKYLTDMLTDEAVALIHRWQDQPFFMHLSHYAVHTPIQGRKELVAEYRRKLKARGKSNVTHDDAEYAAMVEAVDRSLGRVMGTLDRLGVAEHTVIIFTSDNGGLDRSGRPTDNAPLRAGKGSAYEGGVRIPTIVKWPGHTPPDTVSDEPIITHDLYPTVLEMARVSGDASHNAHVDGQALTPILRDPQASLNRDGIYWHYPHYHPGGATPYSAVRAGDWRLLHFYEEDRYELYNLASDIDESENLIDKRPDKARALKRQLNRWRERVQAQPPQPYEHYQASKAD